jgi:hypothetical protein
VSEAAQQEKSVCQAWHCGTVFDGLDRHCPVCGNVAVPQKRIRRLGVVLIVCGVFIVGMMAALSWFMIPLILAGGQEVAGSSFSGSQSDGLVIIAIFALVAVFGAGAIAAGTIQVRHGRQNWRLVGGMVGVISVVFAIAWLIQHGLLMQQ